MHDLSGSAGYLHHGKTDQIPLHRNRHRSVPAGCPWFTNGPGSCCIQGYPTLVFRCLMCGILPREQPGPAGRCTVRQFGHRDKYGRIFALLHALSRKAFILHQLPQGKHLNHPPDIPGSYKRRITGMEGAAERDKRSPYVPRHKCSRDKHPDPILKKAVRQDNFTSPSSRREVY